MGIKRIVTITITTALTVAAGFGAIKYDNNKYVITPDKYAETATKVEEVAEVDAIEDAPADDVRPTELNENSDIPAIDEIDYSDDEVIEVDEVWSVALVPVSWKEDDYEIIPIDDPIPNPTPMYVVPELPVTEEEEAGPVEAPESEIGSAIWYNPENDMIETSDGDSWPADIADSVSRDEADDGDALEYYEALEADAPLEVVY